MVTSVYLSNNNIQAVVGRVNGSKLIVSQMCQLMIPEGSLINGVITNEDELKELLNGFWERYQLPRKDVSLVINSSQFIIKSMTLPKMGRGKLQAIIPKEFVDVERAHDPLYDYLDVTQDRKAVSREILGIMVERSFIESYINLFKDMGIKLKGIVPSRLAETEMLMHLPQIADQICIVLLVDGDNLTSILWEKGACLYHNRTRLFSDHGTPDFGVEAAQSANRLIQFYQAHQREVEERRLEEKEPEEGKEESQERENLKISEVLLGGIEEEDHSYCVNALQMLSLDVDYLDHGGMVQLPPEELNGYFFDFIPTVGNLYPNANLLSKYKKKGKDGAFNEELIKKLLPVLITFGVCLAACAVIWIPNLLKNRTLNQLNEYLEDPLHAEAQSQAEWLDLENEWLLKRCQEADYAGEALDSYPVLNSDVKKEIEACTKGKVIIDISSFYAVDGALTMKAKAEKADDINRFIEELKKSELFWQVDYTGFNYVETDQKYDINVTCYLAPQKKEQEESNVNKNN